MRVAFVAHDGHSELGGVGTWMENLLPWLLEHGMEVWLYGFVRPGDTPLFDSLRRKGVRMRLMRHNWPFGIRVRWLAKAWRKDRIEVVVPNYFVSAFAALHKLGERRPRSITVLHSDDALYRRVLTEVGADNPDFACDAVVAVSEFLEKAARAVVPEKLAVVRIPYGVNLPDSKAASPSSAKFRVVYTGRLVQEQKRILDTVEAACAAARVLPGASFDFIGDGNEAFACRAMVRHNQLESRVRFLGRLPAHEVHRRLPDYHALLLLSDYEGLPLSLLEAAAVGLVPICTKIESGVGEVVEHRISGWLVEERTAGVVSAVKGLINEPELWARCSAEVRARGQRYGVAVCGAQWLDLLRLVRARRPASHQLVAQRDSRYWVRYQEFAWDYGFAGTWGQRGGAIIRRWLKKLGLRSVESAR